MTDAPLPILVVEDDPDTATLTLFALEEAGVANRAVIASDGMEALELLFAPVYPLTPALILLDLAMPRMDGWETLRRLRRDPRTAEIPVIIVSSSDPADGKEKARSLGANGYLKKSLPFARFSVDLRGAVLPCLAAASSAGELER